MCRLAKWPSQKKNRGLFRWFDLSPELINLRVMPYVRDPLSLRNVEDLLFERGIDIRNEKVRLRWARPGPSAIRLSTLQRPMLPRPQPEENAAHLCSIAPEAAGRVDAAVFSLIEKEGARRGADLVILRRSEPHEAITAQRRFGSQARFKLKLIKDPAVNRTEDDKGARPFFFYERPALI